MGVPSFYRWLADKYPKTVKNAVEKPGETYDRNQPNPNGLEFDNLYLDMNGIIHPCFHPEQDDETTPVTYDQVFCNIADYIDRIVNVVRPRKLLYLAIDGVAPRAKMNQQRSRRFRTAKDRQTLDEEENRLRNQYKLEGRDLLPKEESEVADSNIITPGTEFMYELSKYLQTYVRLRIADHHAWRHLRVILSDASSPGEGEHKIMSFIRLQRTCKGYDPNTSHVLYGLDADLIMLALATHEIHFSILRENVRVEGSQRSESKFDPNRASRETAEQMRNLEISTASKSVMKKPYQFLHVWILREYLILDLKTLGMPDKFVPDIERLIDDFIFICFFAGNDFLPHMPTLEIHEGAIDLLLHVYKEEFKNLGGYLVDVQRINERKCCYIKLKRVEKFILAVSVYEDKIFKKRSSIHESILRRILSDMQAVEAQEEDDLFPSTSCASNQKGSATYLPCNSRSVDQHAQIVENTKMLKEQLKSYTRGISDLFRNGLVTDMVKFGNPQYKQRYYKSKFSAETERDIEQMRKKLVEEYTKGLCWVLLYYFSDVPSWTWFYPYHYGPFASDLKGLSSIKVTFFKGSPFKPFDQLMAVLPPTSAHALPRLYQSLMTDEESSILDFYPSDFITDTDGKRFLWQGVCKLPFIDEDRLLSATNKIENELSNEEVRRNKENVDKLFVHSSESFATRIASSLNDVEQHDVIKIDTDLSGDISGFVRLNLDSMKDQNVLCLYYDLPSLSVHVPRVLEGTTIPDPVVDEDEIEERQLWHDICGYQNNRGSNPNAVTRGGGSSWNARGRGRASHSYDLCRGNISSYNDERANSSNAQSWSYGSGRGSTNSYSDTRTNNPNGQSWSYVSGRGNMSGYNQARATSSNGQFCSYGSGRDNSSGYNHARTNSSNGQRSSYGSGRGNVGGYNHATANSSNGQSLSRGSGRGNTSSSYNDSRINNSNGQSWSRGSGRGNTSSYSGSRISRSNGQSWSVKSADPGSSGSRQGCIEKERTVSS